MPPPREAPVAVEVRSARPADRPPILTLVRRAFTSEGHDGQEEVDIVEGTWRSGATVEGLELVAVVGGRVIGHTLAARVDLGGHDCVAMAPLCVSPEHHNEGVGSALVEELIRRADEQGWPLVLVLGDPGYYRRFGFEPSGPYGIVYPPVGEDDPHFQVRRLGAFDSTLRGPFRYCWEPAP